MNHHAVFVLSTGRCGTQWLHDAFSKVYDDCAVVTHEPIRTAYLPRRFFRQSSEQLNGLGTLPEVMNHVDFIRETLKKKMYVETGWAHFAALPWLYEALEGKMRVVQLYRNPISTAFSLATQNVYERDDWIRETALTPNDVGTIQAHLNPLWHKMSQYEKCLFYWTEMHLYGQELQRQNPEWAWHAIRFEDLFGSDVFALRCLLEFCGLPYKTEISALRSKPTDAYARKTFPHDWRLIENYKTTCDLANTLGYDVNAIDEKQLASRYFLSSGSLLVRRWRHYWQTYRKGKQTASINMR